MSDQTLWELAQTWAHVVSGRGLLACPSSCHRCQLERWAREKDKEYQDHAEFYGRCGNEDVQGTYHAVLTDLGVPTEGQ